MSLYINIPCSYHTYVSFGDLDKQELRNRRLRPTGEQNIESRQQTSSIVGIPVFSTPDSTTNATIGQTNVDGC